MKKNEGWKQSNEGEDSKDMKKIESKNNYRKHVTKVPRVIFGVGDLVQSDINNPDGHGLLITCDKVNYSIAHLAIQDMLCACTVSFNITRTTSFDK